MENAPIRSERYKKYNEGNIREINEFSKDPIKDFKELVEEIKKDTELPEDEKNVLIDYIENFEIAVNHKDHSKESE